MRRYTLGETSLAQYETLTEEEKQAWLHPLSGSYHSFHVERMGKDTFRFRDSGTNDFYICTHFELAQYIWQKLTCRRVDPDFLNRTEVIRVLSQEEVDDLLSDL